MGLAPKALSGVGTQGAVGTRCPPRSKPPPWLLTLGRRAVLWRTAGAEAERTDSHTGTEEQRTAGGGRSGRAGKGDKRQHGIVSVPGFVSAPSGTGCVRRCYRGGSLTCSKGCSGWDPRAQLPWDHQSRAQSQHSPWSPSSPVPAPPA